MKHGKILKSASLVLTCILLAGNLGVLPVSAGASDIVVDNSSFTEELDSAVWNNPDADVGIEDGVLIFPENSTDTTSLITKTNARISNKHDELIRAEITMQLTKLPEKEQFVIALGLASVEAVMGEAGNVEITFENNGGLKVAVIVYKEDGEAVTIAEPAACGLLGNDLNIKTAISTKGVLDLTINGNLICRKELPVSGEGRLGFLQTGSCAARISDIRIVSHKYDTPENVNVFEDFENETINVNVLTQKVFSPCTTYAPTRVFIDEIDGNRVLRLQNAGNMYLGGLYPYSNFEMTFDVLDLQRKDVVDEDGNIIVPKNENFCISFGGEAADYTDWGYENATDLVIFTNPSQLISWYTGRTVDLAAKGYPFSEEDCDKDFSVRFSVIDSVITVGIKWIDEEEFTDVMQYQATTTTPTGFVHLWTTGAASNFAIDNFRIENKDEDAKIIEADYASALLEGPGDFDYQPLEYVYEQKESEMDLMPYLIILAVAGVCVVVLVIAVLVKAAKKKKKDQKKTGKERGQDEKE